MPDKITVSCPACSKRYNIEASKAFGKRATCGSCGSQFAIDGRDFKVLPSRSEVQSSRAETDKNPASDMGANSEVTSTLPLATKDEKRQGQISLRQFFMELSNIILAPIALIVVLAIFAFLQPKQTIVLQPSVAPKSDVEAIVQESRNSSSGRATLPNATGETTETSTMWNALDSAANTKSEREKAIALWPIAIQTTPKDPKIINHEPPVIVTVNLARSPEEWSQINAIRLEAPTNDPSTIRYEAQSAAFGVTWFPIKKESFKADIPKAQDCVTGLIEWKCEEKKKDGYTEFIVRFRLKNLE